jgi:hypothetical protein
MNEAAIILLFIAASFVGAGVGVGLRILITAIGAV